METFYIVEQRGSNHSILVPNCFLSASLQKIENWLINNQDFDSRDHEWYWVIIKIVLDDEDGGEFFKVYDWNAKELEEQPFFI